MTFLELENFYQRKYSEQLSQHLSVFHTLIFHHSKLVKSHTDLITCRNKAIDFDIDKFTADFNDYFFKLKPLEYIQKSAQFLDLDLYVNKHVLIPRSETQLVYNQFVCEVSKQKIKNPMFLDLCTGSGCLAIALAKQFKDAYIYGSDIDEKCLKVARKNQKKYQLNNLEFIQADYLEVLQKIKGHINYVICNPPYIDESDLAVEQSVKKYEPKKALFAKDNGLAFYIQFANYLKKSKWKPVICCFEFGYQQKNSIKNIFKAIQSKYQLSFFKDDNNLDRCILLTRK